MNIQNRQQLRETYYACESETEKKYTDDKRDKDKCQALGEKEGARGEKVICVCVTYFNNQQMVVSNVSFLNVGLL